MPDSVVSQTKEVANINGEKVENASEEEESEEMESEEEERQQPAEGPVGAVQEATSDPISQVETVSFSSFMQSTELNGLFMTVLLYKLFLLK